MKKKIFSTLLCLAVATTVYARVMSTWPYKQLAQESDVIAVVELVSTANTNALLQGHGEASNFQGYVAHTKVPWVIKGNENRKELE